ncbi:MAG: class I SAM-dependent methyltransferase [Ilumatobacteraceae bacterium]
MSDTGSSNHYFDSDPVVREVRREFTVDSPRGPLRLEAATGVFARHGLDKGTSTLLDVVGRHPTEPPPRQAHLCDIGSGSGALALVLAATHPDCTVHAVDVNERARRLCADNARRNELTNVVVEAPDDVDPTLRFHLMWSNPPIRIGKEPLHELLETWLARLHRDGHAELVVARNLGADSLAHWLESRGHHVTRIGSAKGFRVLRVNSRDLDRAD